MWEGVCFFVFVCLVLNPWRNERALRSLCVCVCVHACVRACVRACMRLCVRGRLCVGTTHSLYTCCVCHILEGQWSQIVADHVAMATPMLQMICRTHESISARLGLVCVQHILYSQVLPKKMFNSTSQPRYSRLLLTISVVISIRLLIIAYSF